MYLANSSARHKNDTYHQDGFKEENKCGLGLDDQSVLFPTLTGYGRKIKQLPPWFLVKCGKLFS